MKQVHIILIALLLFSCSATAQVHGPVGLGLRANPDGGGFTGKFFFTDHLAVEGQLNASAGNYYDNGTSFTLCALLEHHFIFADPQWRLYLGGGFHYGTWNRYGDAHISPFSVFGVDAIAGLEYIFPSVPLGVSVDVKPSLNFISGVTTAPGNTFGLSVRYYFGQWGIKMKEKFKAQEEAERAGMESADTDLPEFSERPQ